MLFSSVSFLCFFLLAVFALYFLVPNKARNMVLLIASLFFYFYGEPKYCVVMVISALMGYFCALLMEGTKSENRRKLFFICGIVLGLAPLLFFKYSDFFVENINQIGRKEFPLLGLTLPIGISFYTFQILSYVIDVYRKDAKVQKNPLDFLTYVALFPQLIAGPIVRYETIQDELANRKVTYHDVYYGIVRFVVGLFKKVVMADSLGEIIVMLTEMREPTVLSFWLKAIYFTLQLYFDFSGYSDMAIGLSRIFGFHFPENFRYPFMSKSITEFWRRWHISLGTWFRDYVYIPMGGNRCKKIRWIFNIFVVWFLTGFWHGAAWNFIFWGLYFACFLFLEKVWLAEILKKLPRVIQTVYVMVFVVLSFVLFQADSMQEAMGNFQGMFSFQSRPFTNMLTNYYFVGNLVLFLIAIIGSTNFPVRILEMLRGKKHLNILISVAEPFVLSGMLLLILGYLVDGSFHAFLYFRF